MAQLVSRLSRSYRPLAETFRLGCLQERCHANSKSQVRFAATVSAHSEADNYIEKLIPVDQQTIVLPGPDRIHVVSPNKNLYRPDQVYSDVSTMYEGYQRGKRESNDGPFLGRRAGSGQPYEWISYSQAEEKALLFGSGLISLGNKPGTDTFVGIYSQNRPEWVITDIACVNYSMVSVPLFNNIDHQACQHIVNQTNMSTLVCDTLEKAQYLLQNHASMPSLTKFIVMDLPAEGITEERAKFESEGYQLLSFDDVINLGNKDIVDRVLPKPDDIDTIVYTSGTTGTPKGVPITHRSLVANHAYMLSTLSTDIWATPDDVHISYLPLPHVFERAIMYNALIFGGKVGFFQGDYLKLIDDIQELRPTVLFGVPRVFNRVYDRVMAAVAESSPWKRALFNFAYQQKLKALNKGICRRDTIWDKLVFKKIQDQCGGRVRSIATGAAPLAPEVVTFFRLTMGCTFFEAYGQTESTMCISHSLSYDLKCGHVGVPGGDSQMKLVDVPELNYFAAEDKGELCIKGSHVMKGYFKDPEKTKEVLDEDGFLHTGDIGQWNENGSISIIDRKKNIFKLSQGEYIAPEKVENVYIRYPLVAQMFVYGDSFKSCLVGVVVPDAEELLKYAKKRNIPGTFEDLCNNERLRQSLLKRLLRHGREEGLAGYEQVKDIHVHSEVFSEHNGLLTPTMKNKRPVMEKLFAAEIEEMYADLENPRSSGDSVDQDQEKTKARAV